MSQLSDDEQRELFKPIVDLWPDDMPEEEFKALLSSVLVSLVARGEFASANFTSPEAYRRFCERYGIC